MLILGATDVGSVRQKNEDSYRISDSPEFCWGVVCDGVGGYSGGEIASDLVAQGIEDSLTSSMKANLPYNTVTEIVKVGVYKGYVDMLKEVSDNSALSDMGTTVAGAVINGKEAIIFWAGDSRVYLLRGDKLSRVTKDHSVVQNMVSKGLITPAEAEVHPNRNLITNFINSKDEPNLEYEFLDLESGDWLFMCSDGVNDYIPSAVLPGVVAEAVINRDLQVIISKAIEGGGGDNITAVLMQYEER